MGDVEYNERFYWRKPLEMSDCFKDALYRGTPFPIVSLAEYFSLHQEGFSWGGKYREAGYYASVMLWYDERDLFLCASGRCVEIFNYSRSLCAKTILYI